MFSVASSSPTSFRPKQDGLIVLRSWRNPCISRRSHASDIKWIALNVYLRMNSTESSLAQAPPCAKPPSEPALVFRNLHHGLALVVANRQIGAVLQEKWNRLVVHRRKLCSGRGATARTQAHLWNRSARWNFTESVQPERGARAGSQCLASSRRSLVVPLPGLPWDRSVRVP
jgi:hypothetical protein